jgi:hypothetical protein
MSGGVRGGGVSRGCSGVSGGGGECQTVGASAEGDWRGGSVRGGRGGGV